MERDRVSDAPEDGPAGKADLQVVPKVEVGFLAVEPRTCWIRMAGQLSQHNVEAVGAKRRKKREGVWTSRDETQIIGGLCIAGESQRAHCRRAPVEFLFDERKGISLKRNAGIEFNRAL